MRKIIIDGAEMYSAYQKDATRTDVILMVLTGIILLGISPLL